MVVTELGTSPFDYILSVLTKDYERQTTSPNPLKTSLLFQNSSGVKHQPTLLKLLVGIKPELPLRAKNEGMSQGEVVAVGKWSLIFGDWSEQLFRDKERAVPLCIFSEVKDFKDSDASSYCKKDYPKFLEDTYVRPHSDHFSQQPVENHELQTADSEMPVSPGLQLKEKEEEYLRFLQDLTNDILIRSRYQEEALEDVFQMHIKSKRHNLDEEDHKAFVLKKMQCKDTKRFTSALRKPKGSGQALSVHSATTCHSESSLAFFKDKVAKAEGDGITSKVRQLKSQTAVTRIRQLKPVLGHNQSVLTEVERRRIVQSLKKELNITNQPDPSISCNGAWQKAASIPPTCF
ncbi:hypothetical protein llap_775 [Limosa lapponica baueri]|uniref:Uncharacterized protein n=1 Tax=Limosa lapponica baueri TaxID=1758121 RepID=A0A2I0USA5_LIMLA|nr:hypothetical protein llap_775 [Limosa lapponica baueri]